MKANLLNVLKEISDGGLDCKDHAMIIRKIHLTLGYMFYEYPPSTEQVKILRELLTVADKVEEFFS